MCFLQGKTQKNLLKPSTKAPTQSVRTCGGSGSPKMQKEQVRVSVTPRKWLSGTNRIDPRTAAESGFSVGGVGDSSGYYHLEFMRFHGCPRVQIFVSFSPEPSLGKKAWHGHSHCPIVWGQRLHQGIVASIDCSRGRQTLSVSAHKFS